MTSQEKKEYLQQAYKLDMHINTLTKEMEKTIALRDKCVKCTPNYQNDGSTYGSHANGTEQNFINYISALQDYENELAADINKFVEIKRRIKQIIENVPDGIQREILTKRYINFDKWEQIAADMNIGIRWILRLHGRTLDNLEIRQ